MNTRQIHLDFHTSEKIENIGKNFQKEQFQKALITSHANSITLFSKCHHGYSYHPSMSNQMHPGLEFDLLKSQIDAAHEIGVKACVYLSVGFDEKVIKRHPAWRFENKTHEFDNFKTPMFHRLCLNTPYLDYFLEQLEEVLEIYDADEIFLDIAGVAPCCCPTCMKGMLDRGLDPDNDADLLKYAETVYLNYTKKVQAVIDRIKPSLPVFHNSGHIPKGKRQLAFQNSHLEIESLQTGIWGYDHFLLSSKYAENLGMDYLGMTSLGDFGSLKHPDTLLYETSLAIALGAKCSIGDQLLPNGHMDMTTYEMIGSAYKEIEKKEPWLYDTSDVCDVAILSAEATSNESKGYIVPMKFVSDTGAARILKEGKYMFTVIDSMEDFSKYKVIILPEETVITPLTKSKLISYINSGGKLLASGGSVIDKDGFVFDFGASYEGEGEFVPSYVRPVDNNENNTDYIMYTPYKKLKKTNGAELAKVIEPYFNRTAEHFCSHKHTPSSDKYRGSGVICGRCGIYFAWDIFTDYAENGELIAKKLVCDALDILLCGAKSLVTDLKSAGVATLREQKAENRLIAHLLYGVPTPKGNGINAVEDIYPVHDVMVGAKLNTPPKRVYLAPCDTSLEFEYKNGYAFVTVPKIYCHQMVVFDK